MVPGGAWVLGCVCHLVLLPPPSPSHHKLSRQLLAVQWLLYLLTPSPSISWSVFVQRTVHSCSENCVPVSRQSSDSYFSSVQSSPGLDIKLAQIWLTNNCQPWAGYKTGSLLLCHSFLCLRKTDSTVNTVNTVRVLEQYCKQYNSGLDCTKHTI